MFKCDGAAFNGGGACGDRWWFFLSPEGGVDKSVISSQLGRKAVGIYVVVLVRLGFSVQ